MHRFQACALPSSLQSQEDHYLVLLPQPNKAIQLVSLAAAITACTVTLDYRVHALSATAFIPDIRVIKTNMTPCSAASTVRTFSYCLLLSPLSQLQDRFQCPSTPHLAHLLHSLIELATFQKYTSTFPALYMDIQSNLQLPFPK